MVQLELALLVRCFMICLLAWVFPDPLSPLRENGGKHKFTSLEEREKEPETILRPRDRGRHDAVRELMGQLYSQLDRFVLNTKLAGVLSCQWVLDVRTPEDHLAPAFLQLKGEPCSN